MLPIFTAAAEFRPRSCPSARTRRSRPWRAPGPGPPRPAGGGSHAGHRLRVVESTFPCARIRHARVTTARIRSLGVRLRSSDRRREDQVLRVHAHAAGRSSDITSVRSGFCGIALESARHASQTKTLRNAIVMGDSGWGRGDELRETGGRERNVLFHPSPSSRPRGPERGPEHPLFYNAVVSGYP